MPNFKPLPFYHYNWNKDELNPNNVLAPPYDVLDAGERSELAEKSAYNVVNIDLPKSYNHARELVASWKMNNVLRSHSRPVFLLQSTEYKVDGRNLVRWGVMGGMRISPYSEGSVFPHEETYPKAKKDRLFLTQAVQGQISPIFGVFDDPELTLTHIGEETSREEPLVTAEIGGCRHSLWVVPQRFHPALTGLVQNKNVFIADGHHRYETALNFQREHPSENGEAPWDYVFTYLSNISSPGLEIFPYHRVLSPTRDFDFETAMHEAGQDFHIQDWSGKSDFPPNAPSNSFILYMPDSSYLLMPKFEEKDIFDNIGAHVLNHSFLKNILGLTEQDFSSGELFTYTHSSNAAREKVDHGQGRAAFLLRPVPVDVMREVCCSGKVMPRKSTFFHPKLPTGLAFYFFE